MATMETFQCQRRRTHREQFSASLLQPTDPGWTSDPTTDGRGWAAADGVRCTRNEVELPAPASAPRGDSDWAWAMVRDFFV